jgi:hypothetical protein
MRSVVPRAAVLALLAVPAACDRGGPSPRPAISAQPQGVALASPAAAPAPSEPACPGRDFAAFLAAFGADAAVQARYTAFPLPMSALEDGPDEPRTVVRQVGRAAARLPLLPLPSQRAADSLALRTEAAPGGRRHAVLYKPDTDHQVTYVFAPERGCWRLVRVDDQSL